MLLPQPSWPIASFPAALRDVFLNQLNTLHQTNGGDNPVKQNGAVDKKMAPGRVELVRSPLCIQGQVLAPPTNHTIEEGSDAIVAMSDHLVPAAELDCRNFVGEEVRSLVVPCVDEMCEVDKPRVGLNPKLCQEEAVGSQLQEG